MEEINRSVEYAMKKLFKLKLIAGDAKGILIKRDCILIENYTGKTYTYHVFNYVSNASKYLRYKQEAINTAHYKLMIDKMKALEFYNINIPKEGKELIGYIFKNIFVNYGYSVREEQVELSKHMYEVMVDGQISLSDIPVGLGKTHAYLVAAIVSTQNCGEKSVSRNNYRGLRGSKNSIARPILISTSSIRLQQAVKTEYIPKISKMLLENGIIEVPLKAIVRKGKENYLCYMRLKNYVNTLNPGKKRPGELEGLKQLLEGKQIDLSLITGISDYDKRRIMVMSGLCHNCKHKNECRYQRFMEKAKSEDYHFQICNHNYFLADAIKRSKGQKPLLKNARAVVIDEAHKLIDAASTMYSTTISEWDIEKLIRSIKPQNENSSRSKMLGVICREIKEFSEKLFKELKSNISKKQRDEDAQKHEVHFADSLKKILNRLQLNLNHLINLLAQSRAKQITELKRVAKNIEVFLSDKSIYWLERAENIDQMILCSVPKNIEEHIKNDIFKADLPILLTSGTIANQGDFEYFKRNIGIDLLKGKKVIEVTKESPFNYQDNSLLYIAEDLPNPKAAFDVYIEKISEEIEKLIRASNGHALVLFTSYAPVRKTFRMLQGKDFDFPIFQLRKNNNEAIHQYRESKNGVLFGCGSLWEGIDFKGDLLSHLIIVKLPFLIPDPITEYKKSLYRDEEEFQREILIPRMLIRLKQGHGRAIRSKTDTAVISVLDSRANKKYKEDVIAALPKCRVTNKIEDIEKFIQEKKSPDYFFKKKLVGLK
ncbi:MAG: ATP-dependent DNA helicase [Alkaliphilus sp.]